MSKFWATFKLTYSKKVKAKAFIITTVLMILAILLAANLDKIINMFDDDNREVGIVVQDNNVYKAVKAQSEQLNDDVTYEKMSLKEAEKKVKDQTIDQAYVISKNDDDGLSAQILTQDETSSADKAELSSILTQLNIQQVADTLGLNGNDLQKLQAQSNVEDKIVTDDSEANQSLSSEEDVISQVIVMAGTLVMFFIIMTYAQQIAMELATEKVSRVSEMIITSVKPTMHILAKISAVLAVAVTQMVILGVTIAVAFFAFDVGNQFDGFSFEMTPFLIRLIVFGVILLILGILAYVILAAILGNMTSRIEDMAQSLMPVTLLLIAGFYAGYIGTFSPDHVILKILTYVPFFSPFVTFTRLSLASTPLIEGVIAVVIHIVLIGVLLWVAARTYQTAVLTFEKGIIPSIKRTFLKKGK